MGFPQATTPRESTLSVVLRALGAAARERERQHWAQAQPDGAGPSALDGKTLRGAADGEVPAVHLLAPYAVASGRCPAPQPRHSPPVQLRRRIERPCVPG